MRRTIRAIVLVALALLSAIGLGVTSTVTAAPPAQAVTALIAPGTGTPDANVSPATWRTPATTT